MRRLLAACAAAGLALLLVVAPGVSPAAQAATIAPGIPDPVNILPSTIIATKAAATSPEALAIMATQWTKDPAFWRAAAAVQAGGGTSTEVALVAKEAATFAAPATKLGPLLKVVGGVSQVMVAGQVGLMMGNGAARAFGFKDNQVCAEQNGILTAVASFTNGVDCTAFDNNLAEAQRNLDQSGTVTSPSMCIPGGMCYAIAGQRADGNGGVVYCFSETGSGYAGNSVSYVVDPGGVRWNDGMTTSGFCPGMVRGPWPSAGMSALRDMYVTSYQAAQEGKPSDSNRVDSVVQKANPSRDWKCSTTTVNGVVYSHTSAPYTETDPVFQPKCPTIPGDEVPARTVIEQETPGAPSAPVYDQPTTPEFQHYRTTYPECQTGTCMLDLRKVDTSCFAVPGPCEGWFADPTKTDDYTCMYGTHVVDLAECNLYAPTFKPDAKATGNVYADPETGNSVGVKTGEGSSLAPGTSAADPEQARDCFPSGWAVFNPVEWVLKPVGCALQWAFVPRKSSVDAATKGTKDAWEGSTPGKLAQALLVFDFTAPSAGCQGLAVPIPTPDNAGHVHLVNKYFLPACPGDFFAPWAPLFSVFIGGAACIAGFFGAARHLGGIFGYGSLGGDS